MRLKISYNVPHLVSNLWLPDQSSPFNSWLTDCATQNVHVGENKYKIMVIISLFISKERGHRKKVPHKLSPVKWLVDSREVGKCFASREAKRKADTGEFLECLQPQVNTWRFLSSCVKSHVDRRHWESVRRHFRCSVYLYESTS